MSISGGIRRLRRLIDVDTTGIADGDSLVWDAGSGKFLDGSGGGGASATTFFADNTPGNAGTITRTGLQDFDGITGVDGTVTFVYGGGGANRIASGPWVQHVGAWTRPADWPVNGTDLTGYKVVVKGGTLYKGVSYTISRGPCIAGTTQQFWSTDVRNGGNVNPTTDVGGMLVSSGIENTFTVVAPAASSGKVWTSATPGSAPTWADSAAAVLPQITHVVNLQSPSPLAITGSPANVVFTNYNGYNYQTEATEGDESFSYDWNGTDTLTVQPGLYEFGIVISATTTTLTGVYVSVAGVDPAGVLGASNYRFIAIPTYGGGMTAGGIVEFLTPATVSVGVFSDQNTDLGNCTLSFAQLELP